MQIIRLSILPTLRQNHISIENYRKLPRSKQTYIITAALKYLKKINLIGVRDKFLKFSSNIKNIDKDLKDLSKSEINMISADKNSSGTSS